MANFNQASNPSSPILKQRQRVGVQKCERVCCTGLSYIPLVFVYGLTTWAIWVEVSVGFASTRPSWTGPSTSILGVVIYILLTWSYTVAVFVDPGSPLSSRHGYSHLPSQEPHPTFSLTVKSTGGARYCQKCRTRKPDRAHHCSTCRRCVLKMDHHCPWLATCLGLGNYKAFLLFLIYTTVFCWLCFAVSMGWLWDEVFSHGRYEDNLMPINYILLTVAGGIFGIVLVGFTGWHIYLAWRNQTTIESLEKTRYLASFRRSLHQQHYQQQYLNTNSEPSFREQLREIHTNALPGVTRPEEGEELGWPAGSRVTAQESLSTNYAELERARERERYEAYLDEQEAEKLPHAFDLGWRNNLRHVFGENPLLWWLPICNSTGDGWHWEPSSKWLEARNEIQNRRAEQRKLQRQRENEAGWGHNSERDTIYNEAAQHDSMSHDEPERHYLGGHASPV